MAIQVLPPETAMKIAAGEVIERPASVVKELVENCIDAGARNIRVEIKNGGLSYLRVSDDGIGIVYDEVPLAFERHATSKIAAAEDIYKLTTLGFRGEALPSIAAVSQMTLLTRPRNGTDSGSEIAFEGGKFSYHRPAGAPPGTIITVRNLFYNLPARQKWSKSGTSEATYILNIISSYALAYPEIKFGLASEGRTLLQTSGNGDLKDAIAKIYGTEMAAGMLPVVPPADADGVVEEQAISVTGFTSNPNASKPNRNYINFFVNRRWVQSRSLTYAVQEAYNSLIMTGRFPACVLLIEVDPSEVDANVHPQKAEVRFLHERQVFGAVQKAVRAALVAGTGAPIWSPTSAAPASGRSANKLVNQLYTPTAATPPQEQPPSLNVSPVIPLTELMDDDLFNESPPPPPAIQATFESQMLPASESDNSKPKTSTTPVAVQNSKLPLLRVIGQISQTYIVAEGQDGLYLLDQHAVHERIYYEKFLAELAERKVESQLLLEPMLLELLPRQRLLLENESHLQELSDFGFQLEPFGDNTFMLRAVPALLYGRAAIKGLGEMLDEADGGREGGCHPTASDLINEPDTVVPRSWRDRLAASLACHSAIRAGQVLNMDEMREMIVQLERTTNPNACAHGRPTILHMTASQLEKGFSRK